ncbi:MAG: HAMP domain-containing sensor histidine kinase [Bacteroidota bacterium]
MIISLFGLIVIQGLWIKYAIETEKARFDNLVYGAMKSALSKVERRNVFDFIDNRMELPEPPSDISINIEVLSDLSESLSTLSENIHVDEMEAMELRDRLIIIEDSVFSYKTKFFTLPYHHDELHSKIQIVNDCTINTIKLINDSLILNYNKNHTTYHIISDSLENIVALENDYYLLKKEELVKNKLKIFNENMEQWVMEFTIDEGYSYSYQNKIEYDSAITIALENSGININFDYQLIKEDNDTILIISSSTNGGELLPLNYKTEVYPDDIFSKELFLVINFPDRNTHIYRQVAILVIGSIIFTLIILLTFGSTLYYIIKQKKLSEIKSDFINNMTHEFKTPIATIGLAADAMESPKVLGVEKPTLYYLDIIRQENKRMNNQVERVLQMALIEQGRLQLDLQETDIHDIIQNSVKVVELLTQKSKGEISTFLRANCHILKIDEIHITNVMNNLLDNALKYSDRPPKIMIETYQEHNLICIRVSDNGLGMTKEVQSQIFNKFYRKPTGNIHNVKGFGLGLSYVKAVIESHNGSISVSSEPNNGSTFTIKLSC